MKRQPISPVQVRTYHGQSQAEVAAAFAADASEAASRGFRPTNQVWDGLSLVVTYQLQTPTAKPMDPIEQGFRWGCGCLTLLLVASALYWLLLMGGLAALRAS